MPRPKEVYIDGTGRGTDVFHEIEVLQVIDAGQPVVELTSRGILEVYVKNVLPHLGKGTSEDLRCKRVSETAYCAAFLGELGEGLTGPNATYSSIVDALGLDQEKVDSLVQSVLDHEAEALEAAKGAQEVSPEFKQQALENAVDLGVRINLAELSIGILAAEGVYNGLSENAESWFLTSEESKKYDALLKAYDGISSKLISGEDVTGSEERVRKALEKELAVLGNTDAGKSRFRREEIREIKEKCLIPSVDLPGVLTNLSNSANLIPDKGHRTETLHLVEEVAALYEKFCVADVVANSPLATVKDYERAKDALQALKAGLGTVSEYMEVEGFSVEELSWPLDIETATRIEKEVNEDVFKEAKEKQTERRKSTGDSVPIISKEEAQEEIEMFVKKAQLEIKERKEGLIDHELAQGLELLLQHGKPKAWEVAALLAQNTQLWCVETLEQKKAIKGLNKQRKFERKIKIEAVRYQKILKQILPQLGDELLQTVGDAEQLGFGEIESQILRDLAPRLLEVQDSIEDGWHKIIYGKRSLSKEVPNLLGRLQDISLQIGGVIEGSEQSMELVTLRAAGIDSRHVEEHDLKILSPVMNGINRSHGKAAESEIELAREINTVLEEMFSHSKLTEVPAKIRDCISLQIAEALVAKKQSEEDQGDFQVLRRVGLAQKGLTGSISEAQRYVYGDVPKYELGKVALWKKLGILAGMGVMIAAPVAAAMAKDKLDHVAGANTENGFASAAYGAVTEILSGITPKAYAQEPQATTLQGASTDDYLKNGSLSTDQLPYLGVKFGADTTRTSIGITGNGQNYTLMFPSHPNGVTTRGMTEYSMGKHNLPSGYYTVKDQKGQEYQVYVPEGRYDPNKQIEFNRHQPWSPEPRYVPPLRPDMGDPSTMPPYMRKAYERGDYFAPDMQPQYSPYATQSGGGGYYGGGQGNLGPAVYPSGGIVVQYVPIPQPPPVERVRMNDPAAVAESRQIGGEYQADLNVGNRSALSSQTARLEESAAYCDPDVPNDCADLAARMTPQEYIAYETIIVPRGSSLWALARDYIRRQDAVTTDFYEAYSEIFMRVASTTATDDRSYGLLHEGDKVTIPVKRVKKPAGVSPEELDKISDDLEWKRNEKTASAIYAEIKNDPEAAENWQGWADLAERVLAEQRAQEKTGLAYIIPSPDSVNGQVTVRVFTNLEEESDYPEGDPRHDNVRVVLDLTIDPSSGEVADSVITPRKVDEEEYGTRLAEAQENFESADEAVGMFLAKKEWDKKVKDAFKIAAAIDIRADKGAKEVNQNRKFYLLNQSTLLGGTTYVIPEGAEPADLKHGFKGTQFRLFVKTPEGGDELTIGSYTIVDYLVVNDEMRQIIIHQLSEEAYQKLLEQAKSNYDPAQIGLDPDTFRPALLTKNGTIVFEGEDVITRDKFEDPGNDHFWTDIAKHSQLKSREEVQPKHIHPRDVLAQAARKILGENETNTNDLVNNIWREMSNFDAEHGTDITKNIPEKMASLDLVFSRGYHELKAIFNGVIDFNWAGMDDEELANLGNALTTFANIALISKSEDASAEFRQALDRNPVLKEMIEKHSDGAARILNTVRSEEKIREFADDAVEGQIQRLPSVRAKKGEDGKIIPVVNIKDNRIISSVEEMMRVAERLYREQSSIEPEKQEFLEFMFTPQVGDEELEHIRLDEVQVGPVLTTEDHKPSYPQVYENKDGREMIQLFVPGIGPEEKGITVAVDREVFDEMLSDPDLREKFLKQCPDCLVLANAKKQQAAHLEKMYQTAEVKSPAVEAIEFLTAVGAAIRGVSVRAYTGVSLRDTFEKTASDARMRMSSGSSEETSIVPGTSSRRFSSEPMGTGGAGGDPGDFRRADEMQIRMAREAVQARMMVDVHLDAIRSANSEMERIDPRISEQRYRLVELARQREQHVVSLQGLSEHVKYATGVPSYVIEGELAYSSDKVLLGEYMSKLDRVDGQIRRLNPNDPLQAARISKLSAERESHMSDLIKIGSNMGLPRELFEQEISPGNSVTRPVLRVRGQELNELSYRTATWIQNNETTASPELVAQARDFQRRTERQLGIVTRAIGKLNPVEPGTEEGLRSIQNYFDLPVVPREPELYPLVLPRGPAEQTIGSLPKVEIGGQEVVIMTLATGITEYPSSIPGEPSAPRSGLDFIKEFQGRGGVVYVLDNRFWLNESLIKEGGERTWYKVPNGLELNESGEIVVVSPVVVPQTAGELLEAALEADVIDQEALRSVVYEELDRGILASHNLNYLVREYGFDAVSEYLESLGIKESDNKLSQYMRDKPVEDLTINNIQQRWLENNPEEINWSDLYQGRMVRNMTGAIAVFDTIDSLRERFDNPDLTAVQREQVRSSVLKGADTLLRVGPYYAWIEFVSRELLGKELSEKLRIKLEADKDLGGGQNLIGLNHSISQKAQDLLREMGVLEDILDINIFEPQVSGGETELILGRLSTEMKPKFEELNLTPPKSPLISSPPQLVEQKSVSGSTSTVSEGGAVGGEGELLERELESSVIKQETLTDINYGEMDREILGGSSPQTLNLLVQEYGFDDVIEYLRSLEISDVESKLSRYLAVRTDTEAMDKFMSDLQYRVVNRDSVQWIKDWEKVYEVTDRIEYTQTINELKRVLEDPQLTNAQRSLVRTEIFKAADVMLEHIRLQGGRDVFVWVDNFLLDEILGKTTAEALRNGDLSTKQTLVNMFTFDNDAESAPEHSHATLRFDILNLTERLVAQDNINSQQILQAVHQEIGPLLRRLGVDVLPSRLLIDDSGGEIEGNPGNPGGGNPGGLDNLRPRGKRIIFEGSEGYILPLGDLHNLGMEYLSGIEQQEESAQLEKTELVSKLRANGVIEPEYADLLMDIGTTTSKGGHPEAGNLEKVTAAISLREKLIPPDEGQKPIAYIGSGTDWQFPVALGARQIDMVDYMFEKAEPVQKLYESVKRFDTNAKLIEDDINKIVFEIDLGKGKEAVTLRLHPVGSKYYEPEENSIYGVLEFLGASRLEVGEYSPTTPEVARFLKTGFILNFDYAHARQYLGVPDIEGLEKVVVGDITYYRITDQQALIEQAEEASQSYLQKKGHIFSDETRTDFPAEESDGNILPETGGGGVVIALNHQLITEFDDFIAKAHVEGSWNKVRKGLERELETGETNEVTEVYLRNGEILGAVNYVIEGGILEIRLIEAIQKGEGIGRALARRVLTTAMEQDLDVVGYTHEEEGYEFALKMGALLDENTENRVVIEAETISWLLGEFEDLENSDTSGGGRNIGEPEAVGEAKSEERIEGEVVSFGPSDNEAMSKFSEQTTEFTGNWKRVIEGAEGSEPLRETLVFKTKEREIVGAVNFEVEGEVLTIHQMESILGQKGVGSALFEKVIETAIERNLKTVTGGTVTQEGVKFLQSLQKQYGKEVVTYEGSNLGGIFEFDVRAIEAQRRQIESVDNSGSSGLAAEKAISREEWTRRYVEEGAMSLVEEYRQLSNRLVTKELAPEQAETIRASMLNMADSLLEFGEQNIWFYEIVGPEVCGQETWMKMDRIIDTAGATNRDEFIGLRNKLFNRVREVQTELGAKVQNIRSGITEDVIAIVREQMRPDIEKEGLRQGSSMFNNPYPGNKEINGFEGQGENLSSEIEIEHQNQEVQALEREVLVAAGRGEVVVRRLLPGNRMIPVLNRTAFGEEALKAVNLPEGRWVEIVEGGKVTEYRFVTKEAEDVVKQRVLDSSNELKEKAKEHGVEMEVYPILTTARGAEVDPESGSVRIADLTVGFDEQLQAPSEMHFMVVARETTDPEFWTKTARQLVEKFGEKGVDVIFYDPETGRVVQKESNNPGNPGSPNPEPEVAAWLRDKYGVDWDSLEPEVRDLTKNLGVEGVKKFVEEQGKAWLEKPTFGKIRVREDRVKEVGYRDRWWTKEELRSLLETTGRLGEYEPDAEWMAEEPQIGEQEPSDWTRHETETIYELLEKFQEEGGGDLPESLDRGNPEVSNNPSAPNSPSNPVDSEETLQREGIEPVEVSEHSTERQDLIEKIYSVLKKGREGYLTSSGTGYTEIDRDPELASQQLAEFFQGNVDFAFYDSDVLKVLRSVTDLILFNPSNPQKLNPFHHDAAEILPDFLANHDKAVIDLTKELYRYELREELREKFDEMVSSTVHIGIGGLLASGKTTALKALASDLSLEEINVRRSTVEPEDVEEYYPDLYMINHYIYGRYGTRGMESTLGQEGLEAFTLDPTTEKITKVNIHSGGGHFQADGLYFYIEEKLQAQALFFDYQLLEDIAKNGMPDDPKVIMANGETAMNVTLSLLDKVQTTITRGTPVLGVVTKYPTDRELGGGDIRLVDSAIETVRQYASSHVDELRDEAIWTGREFVLPERPLTLANVEGWGVIKDDFSGAQEVIHRLVQMATGKKQLLVSFGDEQSMGQGMVHYTEVLEHENKENPGHNNPEPGNPGDPENPSTSQYEGTTSENLLKTVSAERAEGAMTLSEMALEPWGFGRTRIPSVDSVTRLFDTLKQLAEQGYTVEGIARISEKTGSEVLNGDNLLVLETSEGDSEIKLSQGLELVEVEDSQAEIARVNGLENDLINGFLFQYISLQIGTRKNDLDSMSCLKISEGRTEILEEINRLEAEAVKAHELAYQRLSNKAVADKWLGRFIFERVIGPKAAVELEKSIKSQEVGSKYDEIISTAKNSIIASRQEDRTLEEAIVAAQETIAPELKKLGFQISAPKLFTVE